MGLRFACLLPGLLGGLAALLLGLLDGSSGLWRRRPSRRSCQRHGLYGLRGGYTRRPHTFSSLSTATGASLCCL